MMRRAVARLSLPAGGNGLRAALQAATVFIDELTWTELRDEIVGRQDDDHRPDRRHRAERSAHGRSASTTSGSRRSRRRSRRRWATRSWRRSCAYVPEGGIHPPTAHMRFPGTITVPDATFEQVARVRGAELSAARLSRHRAHRRPRRLPEEPDGSRRAARIASGGVQRRARHAIVEYYAAAETAYAQALKSRGYRDDEIGTHAGLADTSLALAIDPALVRRDKLAASAANGSR